MAELYKRTITGAAIVTVIVCSVWLGPISFYLLCLAINFLGLLEFYRLFDALRDRIRAVIALILSFTLLTAVFLIAVHHVHPKVLLINLPVISVLFFSILFEKAENPFTSLAFVMLGIVYVTFPLTLLLSTPFAVTGNVFNGEVVIGYFLLLWANDSGAYISGSALGKHALAPTVSPKKTWEGSAGGALCVLVVAYLDHHIFRDLSMGNWLIIAVFVILAGTLGDLVKSAMKRSRHVKDSGRILPGHGGILDRFDSLIGSVPFVYGYLVLLN